MTRPGPSVGGVGDRAPHGRLRSLDALRLLAALGVVLFHFTARDHTRFGSLPTTVFPHLSAVTVYGYAGVHLFFVISGFVVVRSARGRGVATFLASRITRLYPAYWAAVLITAALRWALPSIDDRSPVEVLLNLTMAQDLLGVRRVDGVYWTLWVEWQFYLLLVLLMVAGLTRGRLVLTAGWSATVGTALALLLGPGAPVLAGFLPVFAAGVLLHVLHDEGPTPGRWLLLGLVCAEAAVLATFRQGEGVARIVSGVQVRPVVLALVVLAAVAAVAVCALVPAVRDLDLAVLTAAGTLTYPLYLTHEYVGWALIGATRGLLGAWGALAAAVLGCLLLAAVLHRVVERPVQPRLRRWLQPRLAALGARLPTSLHARAVGPGR
ncbi:acyltransferase family protein [Kineococcus gynurae]|uniref:Acyltransferase family protein n=1 Tax=Kineococcus gynurae TaxID=452979 RepID=A0ABV5LWL1_9ACTN